MAAGERVSHVVHVASSRATQCPFSHRASVRAHTSACAAPAMMTVLGVMVCMRSLPVNWWSYPRHLDTDLCGIVDFECVWADIAYGAVTAGLVVDDLDVLEHHLAH